MWNLTQSQMTHSLSHLLSRNLISHIHIVHFPPEVLWDMGYTCVLPTAVQRMLNTACPSVHVCVYPGENVYSATAYAHLSQWKTLLDKALYLLTHSLRAIKTNWPLFFSNKDRIVPPFSSYWPLKCFHILSAYVYRIIVYFTRAQKNRY